MSKILVLSNGAGEDSIADKVLQELPKNLQASVVCCPLVGEGHALAAHFELCGPRVCPPSEGLFRESWWLAFKDLMSGTIGGHWRQFKFLREVRSRVGLAVAVGDLLPVIMAALAGMPRILFIGTAKSVYHHPYSALERFLLRRFVTRSLVRDQATALKLRDQGVAADWLGNAMMDEVQPNGVELPFETGHPVVTLFPGSRGKAPGVLNFQLDVMHLVRTSFPQLQVGVAVAPGTECATLIGPAQQAGWVFTPTHTPHQLGFLSRGESKVYLLSGVLGDLLLASSVALGQAGTANEQAAGAGVPVVAYDPRGERGLRWYRKRQKGLLGEAVSVVREDQEVIATELLTLLRDPAERERRARLGQKRMGPAGGSERMAGAIAEAWFAE